jgi:hypothetical protein
MHSVTPPSASPNPQHFHSPVSHPTHSALVSSAPKVLGGGPPSAPPALMHATPPHATPPHAAAGNVMPAFSEHDEKNKMRFQVGRLAVAYLPRALSLRFIVCRLSWSSCSVSETPTTLIFSLSADTLRIRSLSTIFAIFNIGRSLPMLGILYLIFKKAA